MRQPPLNVLVARCCRKERVMGAAHTSKRCNTPMQHNCRASAINCWRRGRGLEGKGTLKLSESKAALKAARQAALPAVLAGQQAQQQRQRQQWRPQQQQRGLACMALSKERPARMAPALAGAPYASAGRQAGWEGGTIGVWLGACQLNSSERHLMYVPPRQCGAAAQFSASRGRGLSSVRPSSLSFAAAAAASGGGGVEMTTSPLQVSRGGAGAGASPQGSPMLSALAGFTARTL